MPLSIGLSNQIAKVVKIIAMPIRIYVGGYFKNSQLGTARKNPKRMNR